MPGKHSKKPGPAGGEPSSLHPGAGASAADLRAQMAILAEQVRRLGDRVGPVPDSGRGAVKPPTDPAPPPAPGSRVASVPPGAPEPSTAAGPRIATPPVSAEALSPAPPRSPLPASSPVPEAPFADRASALMAGVIRAAERAADAIRESAEREAARIRARATSERPPGESSPTERP